MATSSATANGKLDAQLADVNRQIVDFQARKLDELKSKLEALIKKKAAAEKEYEEKFAKLKDDWCAQNDEIAEIRQELIDAFKTPGWRDVLRKCVCKLLDEKREQEQLIDERKGPYELKRDQAAAALEKARQTAEGWESAAAKIRAILDANKKTIEVIRARQRSPDRAFALYLMWFELLPAHAGIMPDTQCFKVPPEEQPEYICAPVPAADCDTSPPPPKPWPNVAPWLIDTAGYAKRIDESYETYGKAKEAYAHAQAEFARELDDLPSLRKKLDELTKSLRDKIEICLNQQNAKGCCETERATAASK